MQPIKISHDLVPKVVVPEPWEGQEGTRQGARAGSEPPPRPPQGPPALRAALGNCEGLPLQAHSQHCALSSTLFPTKTPEASGVYTNHKPLSGSCIYKLRHVEIKGDTT